MRLGSEVIEELRKPAPDCRTQFVSFWNDLDHLMDPLETASIDHPDLLAQSVQVSGSASPALPVHPAVAAGIRQALDFEETQARPVAAPAAETGGLDSGVTPPQNTRNIERQSNARPKPCPPSPETRPNARFPSGGNLRKIVAPAYRRVQSPHCSASPCCRGEREVGERPSPVGDRIVPAPASDAAACWSPLYGGQEVQYGDFTSYYGYATTGTYATGNFETTGFQTAAFAADPLFGDMSAAAARVRHHATQWSTGNHQMPHYDPYAAQHQAAYDTGAYDIDRARG